MKAATPLKVMVIDDKPLVAEGFKICLGDDHLITGFTCGEDALAAAEREVFPVVILDLRMEGLQGIEVLKRLKRLCPHQQVIIHTGHASRESAIDAVNLGAFRYLLKPYRVAQLKQIVAGAFAQFEREAVMNRAEPETGTLLGSLGLSEREAEVAAAIVEGKTNREISRVLFISLRTVEKHVQRIFSHFGISSRNKLASKLRDCKSLRESESANPFRQGAVPRTRRLR